MFALLALAPAGTALATTTPAAHAADLRAPPPLNSRDASVCLDGTMGHRRFAAGPDVKLDSSEVYGFCVTFEKRASRTLDVGLQFNYERDEVHNASSDPAAPPLRGKLASYAVVLNLTAELARIPVGPLILVPHVGAGPGFAVADLSGTGSGVDGAALMLAGDLYAGLRVPLDRRLSVFVELWTMQTAPFSIHAVKVGSLNQVTLQFGFQVNGL